MLPQLLLLCCQAQQQQQQQQQQHEHARTAPGAPPAAHCCSWPGSGVRCYQVGPACCRLVPGWASAVSLRFHCKPSRLKEGAFSPAAPLKLPAAEAGILGRCSAGCSGHSPLLHSIQASTRDAQPCLLGWSQRLLLLQSAEQRQLDQAAGIACMCKAPQMLC